MRASRRIAPMVAMAVILLPGAVCGPPPNGEPRYFEQSTPRALDLVFVLATTPSIEDEQANLTKNFPVLMNLLKAWPGGYPDLHVGVLNASLDMGRFTQHYRDMYMRCLMPPATFQAQAVGWGGACKALPRGTFIESLARGTRNNFDGDVDIAGVFSCIGALGTTGCGPDQHLKVLRRALGGDGPVPPGNEGFLQDDGMLAAIFLTDDWECSIPEDSDLYDPGQTLVTDPLGPLSGHRCVEFGVLCDGRPPPRTPGVLRNCHSAEEKGRLIPLRELVSSFRALRPGPGRFFAAAIAPPPEPFEIVLNPAGGPVLRPSCTSSNGSGHPSTRLADFTTALGRDGMFESVCSDSFAPAMERIARSIGRRFHAMCLQAKVADADPRQPGLQPACEVSERHPDPAGGSTASPVPPCEVGGALPCWELRPDPECDAPGLALHVERTQPPPPGTVSAVRCRCP